MLLLGLGDYTIAELFWRWARAGRDERTGERLILDEGYIDVLSETRQEPGSLAVPCPSRVHPPSLESMRRNRSLEES